MKLVNPPPPPPIFLAKKKYVQTISMGYHYMYQYLILIDPSCLFDLIMIILVWTEQDLQTLVF